MVIHGGTVIDPGSGIHIAMDLGIQNRRIAAVADHVSLTDADDALDATGLLGVPGLADLHVHVYWGVADLFIEPGPTTWRAGATTIVDAGSSGANTFPGFRRFIMEPSRGASSPSSTSAPWVR